MRKSFIVLLAVVLAGCAAWARVEKAETDGPDKAFTVNLPVGWVKRTMPANEIFVTRDGPGLESIVITRQELDKAFPKTKQKSAEGMLPSELAELQVAEMKSQGESMAAMDVLENTPASVAGQPAYRIKVQFRNDRGLRFEKDVIGLVYKGYYYTLAFQAPALYYADRYRGEFEQVTASMQLK
jgi:hypothetical protein